MPKTNCCVINCHNREGGHLFPKDKNLRKKWQFAINRVGRNKEIWKPSDHSIVCYQHFQPSDYFPQWSGSKKRRLFPSAVPSLDLSNPKVTDSVKNMTNDRAQRILQRECMKEQKAELARQKELHPAADYNVGLLIEAETEMGNDLENMNISDQYIEDNPNDKSVQATATTENQSTQTMKQSRTIQCIFGIECFQDNPEMINYYTGFESYEHFSYFFSCLGPATSYLRGKSRLSPKNELFLTLMKLRLDKDDIELAALYNVTKCTVGKIFHCWLNFMYYELSELDIWVPKDVIQQYMPEDFQKQFPNTRVTIDATEIPIQRPQNVKDQRSTWSSYKNCNTIKTLVGVTPRGQISFISDSYGGSASDRQILENSSLLDDGMFEKHDEIMADRGFMVQDLFAPKDIFVNTPAMLRGASQLPAETVVRDRRIASKRIHVERVIGLAKTYKMLRNEIKKDYLGIAGRIVKVIFMICNFKPCIVNDDS